MDSEEERILPVTNVLAIASHVVYGYVGNKMASFVMQALGCDVSILDTVNYSNHVGYGQFTGTRATSKEILDLYKGLKQSNLDDFDVLLTGYAPGAEALSAVGEIGKSLKVGNREAFWVLDPVMGDNGKLYVNPDVVPEYKSLLHHADLILPNQFELETLSDIHIESPAALRQALQKLHKEYALPHIVVTSVRFGGGSSPMLSVIGSSATSDLEPRPFCVSIPELPLFFSGTGDMFAGLLVARFREAAMMTESRSRSSESKPLSSPFASGTSTPVRRRYPYGWHHPPDSVQATDTPLARAVEKVLASMAVVLEKTQLDAEAALARDSAGAGSGSEEGVRVKKSKAAEVRVVRHVKALREPLVKYKAEQF